MIIIGLMFLEISIINYAQTEQLSDIIIKLLT